MSAVTTNPFISLHADDNIAVAARQVPTGTTLEIAGHSLTTNDTIDLGHKVAVTAIVKGQPVKKFGQTIGFASRDIPAGTWVHTHNVVIGELELDYACASDIPPDPAPITGRTFMGYRRPDGRAATRNYVGIISTVNCSASTSKYAAAQFDQALLEQYENIDGIIPLVHKAGCAMQYGGDDHYQLNRVLSGFAKHPNIGAYVIVGLGCETGPGSFLAEKTGLVQLQIPGQQPEELPLILNIQDVGGVRKTVERTVEVLKELLPEANKVRREPIFIDKPIAGSLTDAVAIFDAAQFYDVPVFSSSSLRYSAGAQAIRNGAIGEVVGCDAYSPCSLEATHPDFYWYGIHGVETLFTCMGTGCKSVVRVGAPNMDVAVGTWDGGRIGTFRGIRGKGGYGGTAFGTKEIRPIGKYDGYKPLLVEIVKFFRTGKPPVSAAETLQIYAFMEAADESKRQGGVPVTLASVMKTARAAAAEKSLATPNQLTEAEKADGWRLLFNGKDHTGWHCNNGKEIATPVEEGSLVPFKSGGYLIIHEDQFGDFVLKCDVKMSSDDCNSGIFFRVADPKNPVMTGFEAQVYSGGTGIHDFGAIYDLVPATRDVVTEPGDWNSLQITCKGPHIQIVANGEVVSEMNCDDFTEKGLRPDGTEHKFGSVIKDAARKGYLGFQDHGQKVWVRNVKIKELD